MIYRFVITPSVYEIIGRPMMNHSDMETAVKVAEKALSEVCESFEKRSDGDSVAFIDADGVELMRVVAVSR